jgi:hypothetical protein
MPTTTGTGGGEAEGAGRVAGLAESAPHILPENLLIAGAVGSEEELASVQQIAMITQWLRLFTWVAHGGTLPGAEPAEPSY